MTPAEAANYLIAAIEAGLPTMQWPAEKAKLVEASYRRYEQRAIDKHMPVDDDEGLAVKISVYMASVGY